MIELNALDSVWSLLTVQLAVVDLGPPVIRIWLFADTEKVCSMALHPVYVILLSEIVQNLRGRSRRANIKKMYLPAYKPGRETGWLGAGAELGTVPGRVVLVGLLALLLVVTGASTIITVFLNSYSTLPAASLSLSLNSLPTIVTAYLLTLANPFT